MSAIVVTAKAVASGNSALQQIAIFAHRPDKTPAKGTSHPRTIRRPRWTASK